MPCVEKPTPQQRRNMRAAGLRVVGDDPPSPLKLLRAEVATLARLVETLAGAIGKLEARVVELETRPTAVPMPRPTPGPPPRPPMVAPKPCYPRFQPSCDNLPEVWC